MTEATIDRLDGLRPYAWGGTTALVLLPLLLLKLSDPNAWAWSDLPFAFVMIAAVGLAFEAALRLPLRWTYRAGAALAAATGFPILADPLSGLRTGVHDRRLVIGRADQLTRQGAWIDAHRPEVVIRTGAMPTSKPIVELLARTQALVFVSQRRWNLRLHSGVDVLLPEGHEDAAIPRLAELHKTQALLDRPLVSIDMRLPDRLVVKQQ